MLDNIPISLAPVLSLKEIFLLPCFVDWKVRRVERSSISVVFRYIFTADPKGMLKLWRLGGPSPQAAHNSARSYNNVSLLGEFASCFGNRVLCLNASFEKEVSVFHNIFSFLKNLDWHFRNHSRWSQYLETTLVGLLLVSYLPVPFSSWSLSLCYHIIHIFHCLFSVFLGLFLYSCLFTRCNMNFSKLKVVSKYWDYGCV